MRPEWMRNEQNSSVDNRHAVYQNAGPVYNAPVSHQTIIYEDSFSYDVRKRNVAFQEGFSKLIISILGAEKTLFAAVLSLLFGFVSFFFGYKPWPVAPLLSTLGVLAMGASVLLFAALHYRTQSRCFKCGMFYALKEWSAKARDVNFKNGVQRTTVRRYQCIHCSADTTRQTKKFVRNWK